MRPGFALDVGGKKKSQRGGLTGYIITIGSGPLVWAEGVCWIRPKGLRVRVVVIKRVQLVLINITRTKLQKLKP